MNLNFNFNSIIKFELMGFAEPIYKIGKVTNVDSTEVAIIPQLKVYRNVHGSIHGRLDQYCTADDDCVVHIRRSLIASWCYAKATDIEIRKFISESDVQFSIQNTGSTKKFEDYTFNEYNRVTGFHKGNGRSCALIKEAQQTIGNT